MGIRQTDWGYTLGLANSLSVDAIFCRQAACWWLTINATTFLSVARLSVSRQQQSNHIESTKVLKPSARYNTLQNSQKQSNHLSLPDMASYWHQEAGYTLIRIVYIVTKQLEAKQPSISARHGQLVTPGGRVHTITDSIYVRKQPEAKQPSLSARHGQLVTPGGRVHTITDCI